ncbi:MAG: ubiquinone-binding protein, partial [Alphaproteobacteria bacterium CG11_big_fil_rev_8_21_14_0_20_44_7]
MRQHSEEIISPYKPEQLYAMVADVAKYPEFIPWCSGARIVEKNAEWIIADLLIGFKGINETYRSKVHLRENEIDIEYLRGPFSHLENRWQFTPYEGGTKISFLIKFEFKSKILDMIMGGLFDKACMKMVGAF